MARLEDIIVGANVTGVAGSAPVSIVATKWHGNNVLEITFKGTRGQLANQLLYREDEGQIDVAAGNLPNNLTVENIKAGNSNIRNPTLASFANSLLPYRGLGSGIIRALEKYPDIDFFDDKEGNLFKVTLKRAE